MNKKWDHAKGGRDLWIAWLAEIMRECLRVLKPGGYCFVWGLDRTYHWTALAVENAGFEVKPAFYHFHAKGFPKSKWLDEERTVGTAIKPAVENWVLGRKPFDGGVVANFNLYGTGGLRIEDCRIPTSEKLERVLGKTTTSASGWTSANRSPIAGKDGGRWPTNLLFSHDERCVPVDEEMVRGDDRAQTCKWMKQGKSCQGHDNERFGKTYHNGTRPGGFVDVGADKGSSKPNGKVYGAETRILYACVPECPVRMLDDQAGVRRSGSLKKEYISPTTNGVFGKFKNRSGKARPGSGPASRFFFVTKPSRRERDAGLEDFPAKSGGGATDRKDGTKGLKNPRAGAGRTGGSRNHHATVKSIELMRWLCRLVTPPGGLVLDPFAGSFSTGCAALLEGLRFIGIEADFDDAGYVEIGKARMRHWGRL